MTLLLSWLFCCAADTSRAQTTGEYKIKAVFLFNFAQFVEWPPNAFPEKDAPIVIGILGSDPFGLFLDDTVRGEVVQGRRLEVRRFASVQQVQGCHILFIGQSEAPRLRSLFEQLRGQPVLTVGENDRFATQGGMVRFLTDQNKIRLRINLEAAQAAGLTISSKLLRAAEIVKTEKE